MPSAIKYIPPTDGERNTFNGDILTERNKRRTAYRTALDYYLGNHDQQLEVGDDAPDDNTQINLVKMAAERTVSFLFSEIPVFSVDSDIIGETEEEKWIRELFEANGGLNFLTKLGVRGFLAGHNFVRVVPQPENLRGKKGYYPKLISLDPTSVYAYWKADDTANILWYEYRYSVGSDVYIIDYVHVEHTDEWRILTYKTTGVTDSIFFIQQATHHGRGTVLLDNLDFERLDFEAVSAEDFKSRIPPIIEFPHLPHPDDYYGLSEFTQKNLQDMINRIASERARIVRENADPIDVVTGNGQEEVEGDGGFYNIPTAGAKVTRLEMKGDLVGVTTVLDKLIETYLAITRVVLLKGDVKDLQRVTDSSVRTLFLDSLAKNRVLQQNYGWALRKVVRLSLEMGFKNKQIKVNPDTLTLQCNFSEPLPTDKTELANFNAVALAGGWIDKRTAAESAGLNWEVVSAQIEIERQADLKNQEEQMEMVQRMTPQEESLDEPKNES